MTNLKPCPFCGSNVEICTADEAYKDQYVVSHIDRTIQMEHSCIWEGDFVIWASSIDKAIFKWNWRYEE